MSVPLLLKCCTWSLRVFLSPLLVEFHNYLGPPIKDELSWYLVHIGMFWICELMLTDNTLYSPSAGRRNSLCNHLLVYLTLESLP